MLGHGGIPYFHFVKMLFPNIQREISTTNLHILDIYFIVNVSQLQIKLTNKNKKLKEVY